MICSYCKSLIEDDSFYCDQCGKEIFICAKCGKTGKGKNCIEDGAKLFSPKQKSQSPLGDVDTEKSATITDSRPVALFDQVVPAPKAGSYDSKPVLSCDSSIPCLRITNSNLKIEIEINSGDIIGRNSGRFCDIFMQFSQISGNHAEFIYDSVNGWSVKDLGSTNGTAVSDRPDWKNVAKLSKGISAQLRNNSYILLANIEFQINILKETTTGTQRL